MSDEKTDKSDYDEDVLAALTRPSLANDLKADDDDGALDLSALVGGSQQDADRADDAAPSGDEGDDGRISLAGPVDDAADLAAAAAVATTAADEATAATVKDVAASTKEPTDLGKAKETTSTAAASASSPATADEKSGSGMWLIAGVALVAVAAVAFALTRGPSEGEVEDEPTELASSAQDDDGTDGPAIEVVDSAEAELAEANEEAESEAPAGEVTETEGEAESGSEAESEETVLAMADTTGTNDATGAAGTTERRVSPERRERASDSTSGATSESGSSGTTAMRTSTPTETTAMSTTSAMESATSESTMSASTNIDDLLNDALGDRNAASDDPLLASMSARMEEPAETLPEKPSRTTTTRILNGLLPRMRRCADGQVGTANGRIRVSNEGRVVSASVSGSPFGGTPQGACMEGVIRTARFPRFSDPHMDVSYPFTIRAIN